MGATKRYVPHPSTGRKGSRHIDAWLGTPPPGRAVEIKTGPAKSSGFLRRQVQKDIQIVKGTSQTLLEWRFFRNQKGELGPSDKLCHLLVACGIKMMVQADSSIPSGTNVPPVIVKTACGGTSPFTTCPY